MAKGVSLNALRVLAWVSKTQSFKLAAKELGVTQSAVSRQIQTLEAQLGVRLIQRDNRVHDLTPSGRLLAPELERIFAQLDELTSTLQENKAADIRTIRVAIHEHTLTHFLAPLLKDFNSLYPHLELQFSNAPEYLNQDSSQKNSQDWADALLSDQLDVVISCGHIQGKQVLSQRLCDLQYVHVGDPQGPLFSVQDSEDLQVIEAQNGLTKQSSSQQHIQYTQINQLESTALAMTLTAVQSGQMLLPHYLLNRANNDVSPTTHPLTSVNPTSEGFHSPSGRVVQCFFSKHKERELAVVAFVNWLQHSTEYLR